MRHSETFCAFGHIKAEGETIWERRSIRETERLVCNCKGEFDVRAFESVCLCHACGCGCGLLLRCVSLLLSLACADVWSSEAGTWLGVWHYLDWRGRISLFCPGGGSVGPGTQWPSSPLAPALSWVTGTPSSKSISWNVQWMEVYVDLSGLVHGCSSIGQSSLVCTGLIRGRQKTRWSTNQQGHSPIVSIHHAVACTQR